MNKQPSRIGLYLVMIAALIAGYGVWKHGSFVKNDKKRTDDGPINIGRAWLNSIPAIALLIMVVAGSSLNKLAGTALLLSQFIHKRMSVVFIPFIVYSYMAYLFGGQAQYERFSLKSVINMSEGAITVTAEYTAVMFASVTLVTFLVYYVVGITKERIH